MALELTKRLFLAITALAFNQLPQQAQWADSAIYLTREMDQAGVDHTLNAISTAPNQNEVPGLVYNASLMPPFTNYTAGAWFVMIPDVPTRSESVG